MAKSNDEGGPALALADDAIRCEKMIVRGGTSERCSRFTIRLPSGERDSFCISHSTSQHAAQVRRKSVLARNASDEAERERRRQFADDFASEPWQTPYEISVVRAALAHRLLLGELSATDVREVRALLDAAERQMLIAPGQWQNLPS